MASTSSIEIRTEKQQLPAVPVTIEGSSVLHQMFRFRWTEWRKLEEQQKQGIAREAAALLEHPAGLIGLGHKLCAGVAPQGTRQLVEGDIGIDEQVN